MTKTFTKEQPRHGDVVFHCGHLDRKPHHFLKSKGMVYVQLPDGTPREVKWVVQCPECFTQRDEGIIVRNYAIWQGDGPTITEYEKN